MDGLFYVWNWELLREHRATAEKGWWVWLDSWESLVLWAKWATRDLAQAGWWALRVVRSSRCRWSSAAGR